MYTSHFLKSHSSAAVSTLRAPSISDHLTTLNSHHHQLQSHSKRRSKFSHAPTAPASIYIHAQARAYHLSPSPPRGSANRQVVPRAPQDLFAAMESRYEARAEDRRHRARSRSRSPRADRDRRTRRSIAAATSTFGLWPCHPPLPSPSLPAAALHCSP